jgi:hypothetical protein
MVHLSLIEIGRRPISFFSMSLAGPLFQQKIKGFYTTGAGPGQLCRYNPNLPIGTDHQLKMLGSPGN